MSRPLRIRVLAYEDVKPWMHRAARERVSLKDSGGTTWYGVPTRSCGALMLLKGKARIKGVYVPPEERGLGLGSALVDRLEEEARKAGAQAVEVYAHNPGFYLGRGYVRIGENQFGVALLRRDL